MAGSFLIIKAGTTVSAVRSRRGDFELWITAGMGLSHTQVKVVEAYQGEPLPPLEEAQAVVVTGSASMVTQREPWSEATAHWLRDAVDAELPVLGICYGHQLLAHAFGGTVDNNPQGRNIGTTDVGQTAEGKDDALFGGFEAVLHLPVSHLQSVTHLPDTAVRLAKTERDPNHAFRLGRYAWGVQFHPEFDAQIVRGYIDARRDQIEREGLNADQLQRDATDTAHGTLLLRRFAQITRRKARHEDRARTA